MTPASEMALQNLRDLTTLKWYVIPLLAIIIVINMKTIQRKIITVSSLYAIAIIANIVAMGILGWQY